MSSDITRNIKNVAIIAHVDHGKTTLAQALIAQSAQLADANVLDSDAQEARRGITILAKCASFLWKDTVINLVDTPGHMDFQSEVERVLGTGMVDAALVVVDVMEGIMPQTETVIQQAARNKLKFIIIINKVDRDGASKQKALQVYDEIVTFIYTITNNDDVFETPVIYASGRAGIASFDYDEVANGVASTQMTPLLDLIVDQVPSFTVESNDYTKCSVTMLDYDKYVGKICIGRVHAGKLTAKDKLWAINAAGEAVEQVVITKLYRFFGVVRKEVQEVQAGDIYGLAGVINTSLNDTIVSDKSIEPFAEAIIEPPMLSVSMFANRSPMAGREGDKDKINARHVQDRLYREGQINPGIKIVRKGEETEVQSRGELQLSYLLTKMYQEGYEFMVGSPVILKRKDEQGRTLEPYEEVTVTIDESHIGAVISSVQSRNGAIIEQNPLESGEYEIKFEIATEDLLGYSSEFITCTSGKGRIVRKILGYQVEQARKRNGVNFMIATANGNATTYAMDGLRDRGIFFVDPSTPVFTNMIVGLNSKQGHLEINIAKEKKLTNVRSAGKDEHVAPLPIKRITMEDAISYIFEPGVTLEITPSSMRLWYKE